MKIIPKLHGLHNKIIVDTLFYSLKFHHKNKYLFIVKLKSYHNIIMVTFNLFHLLFFMDFSSKINKIPYFRF